MRTTLKFFIGLTVLALAFSGLGMFAPPAQAAGVWYVTPNGNDTLDCLSPATACATPNAAINKASSGDIIYVASGVYTDSATSEVMLVNKSLNLLGGWDNAFLTQAGQTVLYGRNIKRGATVAVEAVAQIDHFTFQNGNSIYDSGRYISGLYNQGQLTLTQCVFRENEGPPDPYWAHLYGVFHNSERGTAQLSDCTWQGTGGPGLTNYGILTGTRLVIGGIATTVGVLNLGVLTLNNSAVIGNLYGGVQNGTEPYQPYSAVSPFPVLTLNNTTLAANRGQGGLTHRSGPTTINLNNVTLVNNTGDGINIAQPDPQAIVTLQNTLLANNSPQDCAGSFISTGHNLIGNTWNCAIIAVTGDMFNLAPQVASADLGTPYGALLPGSPAIDAGDPAGCTDQQGAPFVIDQRGLPRASDGDQDGQSVCDIGAVEYTYQAPGAPTQMLALSAPPRAALLNAPFTAPIQVKVLDAQGIPVSNTTVLFTAPSTGTSGSFATGGTTASATSNARGLVTAPILTANNQLGVFTVSVSSAAFTNTANFSFTIRASTNWYVSPAGSDQNACQTPIAACATLQSALARAFTGDVLYVAQGTYTSLSGAEVILVDKDIHVWGGWDLTFSQQTGRSVIDGQNLRRGVTVLIDKQADLQSMTLQNGLSTQGGGLYNNGLVTLTNSLVISNHVTCLPGPPGTINFGGGLYNVNRLWLERTIVQNNLIQNCAQGYGGGLYALGLTQINNSLIQGNGVVADPNASDNWVAEGGGIYNAGRVIKISNSTIIDNGVVGYYLDCAKFCAHFPNGLAGGFRQMGRVAWLSNTVIARNDTNASAPDCSGPVSSLGYNALGNTSGCDFAATSSDKPNATIALSSEGYPLSTDLTVIEGGDPRGCLHPNGTLLTLDLKGTPRPQDGNHDGQAVCDIGAYEYIYVSSGEPASIKVLAGAPQATLPSTTFATPFQVQLLDQANIPVANRLITFAAPPTGPSGIFSNQSLTATAFTDQNGVAIAPAFTANARPGAYTLIAASANITVGLTLANRQHWYVSPTGQDDQDCLSPEHPCATLYALYTRPFFVFPAYVQLAQGTHYLCNNVYDHDFDNDMYFSGGWDALFQTQSGFSVLDSHAPNCHIVSDGRLTLDRFIIQFGNVSGLANYEELILTRSIFRDDPLLSPPDFNDIFGRIYNGRRLTISNSTFFGGGKVIISNWDFGPILGTLLVENSTFSGAQGVALFIQYGTAQFNNVTISQNLTGVVSTDYSVVNFRNSVVANNSGQDCSGSFNSEGYNLIGNTTGCTLTGLQTGDILNQAPLLEATPTGDIPAFALLPNSPAIDAGDPSACVNPNNGLLLTDQRGLSRAVDGNGDGVARCDIGAYEYFPYGLYLPLVLR